MNDYKKYKEFRKYFNMVNVKDNVGKLTNGDNVIP